MEGAGRDEMSVWSRDLIQRCNELDRFRRRYFERYKQVFELACGRLTGMDHIECQYYSGWDTDEDLEVVFANNLESDRRRGYTQRGFHRADIRIRMAGENVANVCSRGELKILAWAMVLGQGWMLTADYGRHPIYLVDDLASELDREHRRAVCDWLGETGCQVVVTGVDREALVESWQRSPVKMFHVEQGRVSFEERINAP